MREVKVFLEFFDQRMQEDDISIMYTPVNKDGQKLKPKEGGKLKLKYLFLYGFEIPKAQDG